MVRIETARLTLRPFTPDDLNDYHTHIYSDPDVTRYLPGGKPRPKDRTLAVLNFAREHGEKHGFTLWALTRQADNQFIGHCGLVYAQNSPNVELAYAIGKAFWRQGYTSEAALASLRYGFETAGLEAVIALADPANIASQRVMQKCGMTYHGETDEYYNLHAVLYRLNRADFVPGDAPYQLTS